VDAGVGAEQEADKKIINANNRKRKEFAHRRMNHIVSENILIGRENN